MFADSHAQQSDGIFLDVQYSPVVVRPDQVGLDVSHTIIERRAGAQVLNSERVLAAADNVFGVCEQVAVGAHGPSANLIEGFAGG